jgi:hypothetical protein
MAKSDKKLKLNKKAGKDKAVKSDKKEKKVKKIRNAGEEKGLLVNEPIKSIQIRATLNGYVVDVVTAEGEETSYVEKTNRGVMNRIRKIYKEAE